MLSGSFYFAVNILFILPILGLLTFVVALCAGLGFVRALVWVLLFPFLCWFCWQYVQWVRELRQSYAYTKTSAEDLERVASLRHNLESRLGKALKVSDIEKDN